MEKKTIMLSVKSCSINIYLQPVYNSKENLKMHRHGSSEQWSTKNVLRIHKFSLKVSFK